MGITKEDILDASWGHSFAPF